MNRFDRITAIFIQLQSRRTVTASDIAERFGISLRTVYRDMRSLEEAGVPLVGEAGTEYSLVEGYRLPPIMFSKEEALSMVTAEKLMDRFTDYSLNTQYKSAIYKIKAVLRSAEKDLLAEAESRIAVLKNEIVPANRNIPLETILNAIATKRVLHLHYFANRSQEHSQRDVEPIGVYLAGNNWHLIAWCCMRQDYRDFRLDRMSDLQPTAKEFETGHPPLATFIKEIAREKELQEVVMHIEKDKVWYLGDQRYYNGFVSQKEVGEMVEMTFLTSSLEGFARWYCMFADVARIITPQLLKDRIRELAASTLSKV